MEIQYDRKQYAEFLCKAYRLNRIIEPLEKTPYVRVFIDASDSERVIISSTHANGIVFSRRLDCVVRKVSDNPNRIFTLRQTLKPIYEKLMLESDDPYYTVRLFPRISLSNNIMEALPYYKDSTQITNIPLTEPITKFLKKTSQTVTRDLEQNEFSGMSYISVTGGKLWLCNVGLRLLGYISIQSQPDLNQADINKAETYQIPMDSIPLVYTVFEASNDESITVSSLPPKYHLMAFQAGSETLYVPQHNQGRIKIVQCTRKSNELKAIADLPFQRFIDDESDYTGNIALSLKTSNLKKALENLKRLYEEKRILQLTIKIDSDRVISLVSWHITENGINTELNTLQITLSKPIENYGLYKGKKFHTTLKNFSELIEAFSSDDIELGFPGNNKSLYAIAYSDDRSVKYGIKTTPLNKGFKG